MKLVAYPESKLEPRKIVVYEEENEHTVCQIYADGAIAVSGRLLFQKEFETIKVIKDNFFLFYENIENINPAKD
jgi:hypothetical protein